MRTDEPARLDLLRGLEELLGPERASTLMTYLPRTNAVATRDDVHRLERRMDERFEAMQRQIDTRFEAMRTLVEERYASLEHQIKGGNDSTAASLRADMNRQTRTIVFALVGAITANASLVLLAT